MNKHEVRAAEFAQHREWAEKQSTAELRRILSEKMRGFGQMTAAREVLRSRGEQP